MTAAAETHLLVVSFHTQEDGVRREAGQAAFDVRLAPQLLRLSVQVVQRPHRLLKLLLVNLRNTETSGHSGGLKPFGARRTYRRRVRVLSASGTL